MSKPGYVKTAKIWKKSFNKEELEAIWTMFKSVANRVLGEEIDWEILSYKDISYGRNNIPPIPETDKVDDTEGVQPKQMRKLMAELPLSVIEEIFVVLGKNSQSISNERDPDGDYYYDHEDNTISWKYVVKYKLLANEDLLLAAGKIIQESYFKREISNDLVRMIALGDISSQALENAKRIFSSDFPYKVSNEFVDGVLKYEVKEADISVLIDQKPFDLSTTLNMENYSPTQFIEKQKEKWKFVHGFIPQEIGVLFLKPEFWDQKVFLFSMDRLLGTKQLKNVSEEQKNFFIKLYKVFGQNLSVVASYIKLDKISVVPSSWTLELYDKADTANDIFVKIIEDSKKGIDVMFSTDRLYHLLLAFTVIKKGAEGLYKKNRFTIRDIEAIEEAGCLLAEKARSGEYDIFADITFQDLAWLKKANISHVNMTRLLELYRKTKDKKVEGIPLLSGSIGEFEYEMLSKKDIRGLVVGNLSQCCQRIGGIGSDCVYYGARNKNSTFFVVTKKGQVIAQSWVWRINEQLTFDSIECVSHAFGESVLECYEEYSKKAMKEQKDLELITVGAYYRTGINNRYQRCGDHEKVNVYSDARTQYIIEER